MVNTSNARNMPGYITPSCASFINKEMSLVGIKGTLVFIDLYFFGENGNKIFMESETVYHS